MKHFIVALMCVVLFSPACALTADSIPAGFAPGAVWLSKTDLEDGQSVQLYTVLYDSASVPIAGNVSFLVDGTSISSQPFELTAGTTKIVSTSWHAVQGSHSISASLEGVINKDTGEALTLGSTAATALTISVAAPPPPSPAVQAAANAIAAIQTSAPVVTQAAQSAYNSLEYLRQNAISTLEGTLAASNAAQASAEAPTGSAPNAADPEILGTSTSNLLAGAGGSSASDIFRGAWQWLLSALLYIAKIQFFFYAALLIILYILYKLLRTVFFERRHLYYREH